MKRIVLVNVGVLTTRSVYRQLWVAGPDDLVVSPIEIEPDYLAYVHEVLGHPLRVLVAREVVSDEEMSSEGLAELLRREVTDPAEWELLPAIFTPGVAALGARLGLPASTALQFAAEDGPLLLNRKSHFRRFAVGAGLPVPEGSVVAGPIALAAAIERHLPRTGTVVVKRDDDSGGRGNIAVTKGEVVPLPGNRATRSLDHGVEAVAAQLWDELFDVANPVLVVESYHRHRDSLFFEYLITEDGRAEFLDSGTIRRRPHEDPAAPGLVWVGLDLPADLPPATAARAATWTARFVELATRIGYRGHLNVDAIVTEDGELLFNEANGRWGGSLTLHLLGERLLGAGWADHHVVSGVRDVHPIGFQRTLAVLRRHGLHFTAARGEGVVVIGYDPELIRTTECVVLAGSRGRAREIEAAFRAATREETR